MARVATFSERTDADDVAIRIDDVAWRHWSELTLNFAIDNYTTVSFKAPFEHDNDLFRATFQPFSYKALEVDIGGERVLTGTLVDVLPTVEKRERVVACTGYSRPGVLHHCPMPGTAVPYDFAGLDLRQIAQRVCAPFGLTQTWEAEPGPKFKKAALKPGEEIQPFLVELAQQRGLVISNTRGGSMLFRKSAEPGRPVAFLKEGEEPLVRATPTFTPEQYYSEITAFPSAKHGTAGSKHRVPNPHLAGVVRPYAFVIEDTDPADAPEAAKAKLGRMFGNAVAVVVDELPTWRTRNEGGDIWEENTTIKLQAPSAMIYRPTEFLIRGVTLARDKKTKKAGLDLVLPGAFSGEAPGELPWVD